MCDVVGAESGSGGGCASPDPAERPRGVEGAVAADRCPSEEGRRTEETAGADPAQTR